MSKDTRAMKLQCTLTRSTTYTVEQHIAWLPEKYAVKGKILDLKVGAVWQEGWEVDRVYPRTKLTEDMIRETQRIVLPSIK